MGRIRVAFIGAATAVLGVGFAAPAYAIVPACGATITTSITLTGDMLNCPGNGLRINASNVTIDLNGHTVSGSQTTQSGPVGIFVVANNANVVIKNGRVTGFSFGVGLGTGTSGNEVTGLTLDGNGAGVSSVSTVMGVNAVTSGNWVHANRTVNNPFQGIGLTGSNNRIEGNSVDGSPTGIRVGASGNDTPSSNNNLVQSNQLVGARITVSNAGGAVVQSNQITTNANLTGILVSLSQGTTVSGNAIQQAADGIGVQSTSSNTAVFGNTVTRNTNNGITVDSPSTTVTANHALYNNNWGIRAVSGVADGGGNSASGNGQPAQCLNVVCS